MWLESLKLAGFRAHTDTSVTFVPGVNVLVGPNGAGKTNILEAIHYLALSKSFLASSDRYVLKQDASFFEVKGAFHGKRRSDVKVRIAFVPQDGKRMFVNGAPLERLAEIVGQVPLVIFTPEDVALTSGGPDERRRFLDNILSQARPAYLNDVMRYRRVVRQRNQLLGQYRRRQHQMPEGVLASWNAELVTLGARIVLARHRFILQFRPLLEEAYHRIVGLAEHPSLRYESLATFSEEADLQDVAAMFWKELEASRGKERDQGRTIIGPHRDELVFGLNKMEVRRYASQGQHRSFGMALKLAQYYYLRDQLGEPPLLLLDDVFDNLDARRAAVFLTYLQSDDMGQSIITAPRDTFFKGSVDFTRSDNRLQRVRNGAMEMDRDGADSDGGLQRQSDENQGAPGSDNNGEA